MRRLSAFVLLLLVNSHTVPLHARPQAAAGSAQSASASLVPLTLGRPLERQLSGGGTQCFLVACEPGQAVAVTVAPRVRPAPGGTSLQGEWK